MATILHITTRVEWDAARAAGSYRAPSLDVDGFIHCSTAAQATASASRYFRGRTDLVLLCIDEGRLAAEVRYEPPSAPLGAAPDPRAAERLPHVYGPIDLDAVIRVLPFPCEPDGAFVLPAEAGS